MCFVSKSALTTFFGSFLSVELCSEFTEILPTANMFLAPAQEDKVQLFYCASRKV